MASGIIVGLGIGLGVFGAFDRSRAWTAYGGGIPGSAIDHRLGLRVAIVCGAVFLAIAFLFVTVLRRGRSASSNVQG